MTKKILTLGQSCCLIRDVEPAAQNQTMLKEEFENSKDMVCYIKEMGQYLPVIMDRNKVSISPTGHQNPSIPRWNRCHSSFHHVGGIWHEQQSNQHSK
jgi:hypothetical protein